MAEANRSRRVITHATVANLSKRVIKLRSANGLDGWSLPRAPVTTHVATYERLITPARRPAVIDCNCVRAARPANGCGRSRPVRHCPAFVDGCYAPQPFVRVSAMPCPSPGRASSSWWRPRGWLTDHWRWHQAGRSVPPTVPVILHRFLHAPVSNQRNRRLPPSKRIANSCKLCVARSKSLN